MNLKISFNIQKDLTHILFEVVLEVGHTNFAGLELEFEILRRFRWICSSVLVDNPGFRGSKVRFKSTNQGSSESKLPSSLKFNTILKASRFFFSFFKNCNRHHVRLSGNIIEFAYSFKKSFLF